ncbi:ABC transporter permease [Xanthomonas hyacinthi]|uniref:ABC transporter permease n=1 Tax=Xanthomonas hyacinthi TaxID=56455 RepID=A0A2S7F1I7_9XANT|nr:ABC transporter permease [Xanthomonas hyacinthi]KLD78880.1 hypothetical protein Y886_07725 [Xanthomonas hyacinthi DSM 19077]PPU99299.1 ABC transporter permease [Xanthomonas hyacinthi]QGY78287.1 ABC transporter permease [Xanthomonas hyacinthi]
MNAALVVYLKEMQESIRDSKTLINSLLLGPLVAPLIMLLVIGTEIGRKEEVRNHVVTVEVQGAGNAPKLVAALQSDVLHLVPIDTRLPGKPDAKSTSLVGLRIPNGFEQAWNSNQPAQAVISYDSSNKDSAADATKLRMAILVLSQSTTAVRLLENGLPPSIITPIAISEHDRSTPSSRAGVLFTMLPYFFILGAFIGGMPIAIDTTAGERERRSLESLFINPVRRSTILIGKIAATSTFSVTTVMISVIAFSLIGRSLPIDRLGMSLDLNASFALTTLLIMAPLCILTASTQILVGAFSSSYRQAQTSLSLLMFVPIVPSILLSLKQASASSISYATPLLSQHLIVSRLLRTEAVPFGGIALCVTATLIAVAVMFLGIKRIYDSSSLPIAV